MKLLSIKIDDDLHKQLKLYAVNQERAITDIVVELVKKELETKKRANTVTLASDVFTLKPKSRKDFVYTV